MENNEDVLSAIDAISKAVAALIGAYGSNLPVQAAGRETVYVYWAGSAGCASIAKNINKYVSKIGTTNNPAVEDRLAELGRDGYGAYRDRNCKIEARDAGFDAWVAHAFAPSRRSQDQAIKVLPRAFQVELPEGMTRRAFDQALHLALRSWSLQLIAPQMARWTAYKIGTVRWSAAEEFYAGLDPRRDADRLLGLIEAILAGSRQKRARIRSA